ncbi:hypothetical protein Sjap_003515 [Stephania japonica]|uniref:Receptor-like serine/threonine-protein kinase n=1 Tax=Stephania japonica TaxID=461633 RepID=A0AAP0KPV6_9MAGN
MDSKLIPLSILYALLILYSLTTHLCIATDTIFAGQSLVGNQTIISRGENFELGFFTPGKSLKYYIGIWYKKISVQNRTVVWVGNRNQPLSSASNSELKLLKNGNLVLLNQFKKPIWTTNSTSDSLNSPQLVLQDDGNLIVRDGSNPSSFIWQSFDHFTDTWLPGGKFRYDYRAMKGQKIISWKNSEDPSPGTFSLVAEQDTEHTLKWKEFHQYWTSGVWNGDSYTATPEMRVRGHFNFSFVSNENESYFTYSTLNKSLLARFVMDISGQIKQLLWVEEAQKWLLFWSVPQRHCDVYNLCGAFGICRDNYPNSCECSPGFEWHYPKDWDLLDYSGGCVRETSLLCGNKDRFLKISNTRLPMNSAILRVESAEKCEAACLSNCSCNAYAYNGTGCLTWFGDLLNTQQLDGGGDDLYLRLAGSSTGFSSAKKVSLLVIGAVVGLTNISVAFIVALIAWKRAVKRSAGETSLSESARSSVVLKHDGAFLTSFSYGDLKVATKKFSEKIGSGSFGCVYKGTSSDSTLIAVKKLEGISQGEKQFRSEVSTIGLIQHVNLVRLRGFCCEGKKRMLVYDFMPNGSLSTHLFHEKGSKVLSWNIRFQIAVGIARGLAYLHEECRDYIIHCDIKPENILLDADFTPKVADFGLAKIVCRKFSHVITTIRGTIGYLAPEWSSGMAITTKADVYSYGMMLFEIISGRRNLKQSNNGMAWFFPTWAANKVIFEEQPVLAILDSKLEGNADINELTRAFRVASWCIREEVVQRPSMGQVVQILEGLLEVNPPPVQSYLQSLVANEEKVNFFSE